MGEKCIFMQQNTSVVVESLSHVQLLCYCVDCSLPGASICGIFQARILEWVAISFPGDLPDPGTELESPSLQANSLLSEPSGKELCRVYIPYVGTLGISIEFCLP